MTEQPFGNNSDPYGAHLAPLSTERIGKYLEREKYHFAFDDDGDPTAIFDGHRFWFIVQGESGNVLQVRGRFRLPINPERTSGVLLMLNDSHRDYIFPTLYLAETDDGPRIMANYSVLAAGGLTDSQFEAAVSHGLGRIVSTFERLVQEAIGDVFLPEVEPDLDPD